jgi:hypothetical protein
MEAIRSLRYLLRHLLSFQLSGVFHTDYHCWLGFRQTPVSAHDGPTLRCGVRGHDTCLVVCRSLQCVRPIRVLGRNCLHLVLAERFIRPAWLWLVLVAFLRLQSYLHMLTRYVSSKTSASSQNANLPLTTLGSLWVSDSSHLRGLLLHPAIAWLALSKSAQHGSCGHSYRLEYRVGNTWTNYRCVDL